MKTKSEIIESNCKPYGGFIEVINNCGGTLVREIWEKSMDEWAVQFMHMKQCYFCDGTGISNETNCYYCKGVGKVINLPIQNPTTSDG